MPIDVSGLSRQPAAKDEQTLLVTRRDESSRYQPVGFLTRKGSGYRFAYLAKVAQDLKSDGILGFPDLDHVYESRNLFQAFAERVMNPRRPDRAQFLRALDLGADATPLEVLARSGGHKPADTLELLPVPEVNPDGSTSVVFLVHGLRRKVGALERLDSLGTGESLSLERDRENPYNKEAILVSTSDGQQLGWVPDSLAEFVGSLMTASHTVRALKVNGPEVGPRLRLLVEIEGFTDQDIAPFTGPEWKTTDQD